MRIILVIAAALIAAGGTGVYLFQALNASAPATDTSAAMVVAPESKEVLVPATELAAGSILTAASFGRMKLDPSAVTPEMVLAEDAALLEGSVARQVLPKGVPIARSAVVQPGERGFLAAVLDEGMRAITIAINEVAGMSGLVLPGDRVDIILTYAVDGDTIDAERQIRASETLLTNLRVLALDNRLNGAADLKDKDGNIMAPPIARTATLEVMPQQAEMMTLASTLGDLSLVLNSVRDGGRPSGGTVVAAENTAAKLEKLRLGASRGVSDGRDLAGPRALTLDSDVTSLLQREAAERTTEFALAPAGSPVPVADRTSRVQIVRGTDSRAIQLGAGIVAAPAGDPAAPPQPAAE